MIKVGYFAAQAARGPAAVPLFTRTDEYFEKIAAPALLPEVARYIASLRPSSESQYVLVNAMGAGEYWGSNVNGDYFPEAALIHAPDNWAGSPLIDQAVAKKWPYGYPTFYNAKPFAHHRNKDASKGFGEVELAAWNPRMKRVELVVRVDRKKCAEFGGQGVWDKLKIGSFPDVSMGTRVPFDTCFPAGTLIRTLTGSKPIEQIQQGELVISHTGQSRMVTQVMQRQADGLVRVRAAGLPDVRATDNHPFLVLRREQARTCRGSANGQRLRHSFDEGSKTCRRCHKEPEFELVWAAAEALRPGDYLAVPASATSDADSLVTPKMARLLGYYLGDGYIIKQRTGKKKEGDYRDMGVGFSVGTHEEAHLQRLLTTLVESGVRNEPNVYDAGADRKALIVSVYDQDLAAWVQHCGGRTSHHKFLLEGVMSWSLESKLELVAGYLDTDGSFDETSGQARIASVNRGLLLDVQRLLLSIGVTATVCFAGASSGYANASDCWYLALSAAQAQKFYGRSVKVTKRDVAWESPQSFFWGGYWLTPVKEIEEVDGDVEVFNFSVAEDESYLAEGRAVHNCSICLDEDMYRQAQQTFREGVHKHPGEAVLVIHRSTQHKDANGKWQGKGKIRGLSITRADYCEHALHSMNKILPDGRKVFVYNDYPNFFDISFVFIGADKTAKTMLKIAEDTSFWTVPGAELGERLYSFSPETDVTEKYASLSDTLLKVALLGKSAKNKQGEIVKDTLPSQFAAKAVPVMAGQEPVLPTPVLDAMGSRPLGEVLATVTGMGMVLRPREFQRIVLIQAGERPLADQLEREGQVFPKTDEKSSLPSGGEGFNSALASLLLPLLLQRSAFGPMVEKRVLMMGAKEASAEEKAPPSSLSSPLLRKIGAAYNGYRQELMHQISSSQSVLAQSGLSDEGLQKVAQGAAEDVFTPLSVSYLKTAFWNEVGINKAQGADVERGLPSKSTLKNNNAF